MSSYSFESINKHTQEHNADLLTWDIHTSPHLLRRIEQIYKRVLSIR